MTKHIIRFPDQNDQYQDQNNADQQNVHKSHHRKHRILRSGCRLPGKRSPPEGILLACHYTRLRGKAQPQPVICCIFWHFCRNVWLPVSKHPVFSTEKRRFSPGNARNFGQEVSRDEKGGAVLLPKGNFFLDKRGFFLYGKPNRKRTNTLTGKKSLLKVTENCRSVRGSTAGGRRHWPSSISPEPPFRRLGRDGFPHRYPRGPIRALRRRWEKAGISMPMRVVPRKFRLSSLRKKETEAFLLICSDLFCLKKIRRRKIL